MASSNWRLIQIQIQYLSAAISVSANCLLIFLVVTKSPTIMGSYKYLLIYVSVFDMCYTVTNVLATPIIYAYGSAFLVIVKFSGTILNSSIASLLNVIYCALYGCSIVIFDIIFIYRYLVSIGSHLLESFNNWKLIIWFALPFLYGSVWSISMYLLCSQSPRTDEFIRKNVQESLGLALEEVRYTGPYLYSKNSAGEGSINYSAVSAMIMLFGLIIISFGIATYFGIKCYHKITSMVRDSQAATSNQTRALQNQLFHALLAQASIPLFLMYIPAFVLCISTIIGQDIGTASGVVAVTISLFPAFDPFPSLLLIKSYRTAITGCTGLRKTSKSDSVHSVLRRQSERRI